MLSIGIKNSILVILIVLIAHFILKNMILERSGNGSQKPNTAQEKKEPFMANAPVRCQDVEVTQKCDVKPRDDDTMMKKMQEEELMRFVAMGDDSDSKSLDNFFRDNIVTSGLEESKCDKDVCKFKADNQQLPLSTTCNAEVQKLQDMDTKRIKGDCNLKQDKKNVMILTEYENENDMNGGKLFGVLDAFDTFDMNYSSYSCLDA